MLSPTWNSSSPLPRLRGPCGRRGGKNERAGGRGGHSPTLTSWDYLPWRMEVGLRVHHLSLRSREGERHFSGSPLNKPSPVLLVSNHEWTRGWRDVLVGHLSGELVPLCCWMMNFISWILTQWFYFLCRVISSRQRNWEGSEWMRWRTSLLCGFGDRFFVCFCFVLWKMAYSCLCKGGVTGSAAIG